MPRPQPRVHFDRHALVEGYCPLTVRRDVCLLRGDRSITGTMFSAESSAHHLRNSLGLIEVYVMARTCNRNNLPCRYGRCHLVGHSHREIASVAPDDKRRAGNPVPVVPPSPSGGPMKCPEQCVGVELPPQTILSPLQPFHSRISRPIGLKECQGRTPVSIGATPCCKPPCHARLHLGIRFLGVGFNHGQGCHSLGMPRRHREGDVTAEGLSNKVDLVMTAHFDYFDHV